MSGDNTARALLDALRDASSPPRDACERSLAAVEARIVAADEGTGDPRPQPTRAPELLRAGVIAIAIAAAVLLAIRGVAVGIAALRSDADPHDAAVDVAKEPAPARPIVRDEATSAGPASPPAPVLAPRAAQDAPTPIEPQRARAAASRGGATASEPVESADDLAAEAALVRAAKAEKDASAALALLDRHGSQFPNGVLAREREMLRAERLCALGRRDDARAVASRFLADGSDDPLARRMRRVCPER